MFANKYTFLSFSRGTNLTFRSVSDAFLDISRESTFLRVLTGAYKAYFQVIRYSRNLREFVIAILPRLPHLSVTMYVEKPVEFSP